MSTRSEFYSALSADSERSDVWLSPTVSAAVSFGLSATVFIAAIVLTMRRPAKAVQHHNMIPFNDAKAGEEDREPT